MFLSSLSKFGAALLVAVTVVFVPGCGSEPETAPAKPSTGAMEKGKMEGTEKGKMDSMEKDKMDSPEKGKM